MHTPVKEVHYFYAETNNQKNENDPGAHGGRV